MALEEGLLVQKSTYSTKAEKCLSNASTYYDMGRLADSAKVQATINLLFM